MVLFKEKHSITIARFDGGYNSRISPFFGDLSQSPNLQNVEFDEFGAVGTISGITAFGDTAIAAAKIDNLWSFNTPSVNQLLAACNGSFWRASLNTFVSVPSAISIFTSGVPLHAEQQNNVLFISNGYATPHKWNGTEFTRWGIAKNSAPISINTGGATTYMVSGAYYQYVIFGISSSGSKGDYSSASTDMQNANGVEFRITDIPTYPISYGIDYVGIARNTAGLSGVFLIVTQVANGTTHYTDIASDSELLTDAPEDNGEPPSFTVHVPFLGRMFGACSTGSYPENLYFSEINEPEVYPVDNIVRIGPGDGQAIRSIGIMQNGLIIGKDDGNGTGSIYYLYMPTALSEDWVLKKIPTEYGSIAPKRLPNFGNMMAYLNKYGIFDVNEAQLDLFKSDSISFDIQPDIDNFNNNYLEGTYAINFKNKLWISVPYGSSTVNNRIYMYDYVKGRGLVSRENAAWGKMQDININTMVIHEGALYGGSSIDDGIVYQMDSGTNFNGSAIDSYYYTMAISGKKEHSKHTKLWRYALITVDTSGAWNLNVDYITLGTGDGLKNAIVDLTAGGTLWGDAVFGSDTWGTSIEQKKMRVTFEGAVGVFLQLRFRTATADQYFKVHNVEVFYNLKGIR